LAQLQFPPGPEQFSPETRQSLLVQQLSFGMHELLTVQTLELESHAHTPPGVGHVSPVTLQSAVLQHAVLGMQELFATQPV
jgi:hypothetical protein